MKLRFTKHFLFVLASIVILSSCEKSDTTLNPTGAWKLVGGTDLITFKPELDFFELDRGKESRNGLTLPKAASGIYSYSLSIDSIKVQSINSSSISETKYYFKISGTKMTIGNFYKEETGLGDILIFERVK